jgi:hypothetical protein
MLIITVLTAEQSVVVYVSCRLNGMCMPSANMNGPLRWVMSNLCFLLAMGVARGRGGASGAAAAGGKVNILNERI